MSARIKRNAPILRVLSEGRPSVVKALVKGASPDLINTLCECSLNVLKGRVPLNHSQKKRLTAFKKELRVLAKKGTSLKQRKQLLQKGGFLGAL